MGTLRCLRSVGWNRDVAVAEARIGAINRSIHGIFSDAVVAAIADEQIAGDHERAGRTVERVLRRIDIRLTIPLIAGLSILVVIVVGRMTEILLAENTDGSETTRCGREGVPVYEDAIIAGVGNE